MNHLKVEGAGDWLDHGTEHPHRIALSIRADKVQHVVYKLGEGFASMGLQARSTTHSDILNFRLAESRIC